jgi:hypothetical protein
MSIIGCSISTCIDELVLGSLLLEEWPLLAMWIDLSSPIMTMFFLDGVFGMVTNMLLI